MTLACAEPPVNQGDGADAMVSRDAASAVKTPPPFSRIVKVGIVEVRILATSHPGGELLDEERVVDIVRDGFTLDSNAAPYLSADVRVIYDDGDHPVYLVVYLRHRSSYTLEVSRVVLARGYQVIAIEPDYVQKERDLAHGIELLYKDSCPDPNVDFVFGTETTEFSTAVDGVQRAAEYAERHHVPLVVRSSFHDGPGTLVGDPPDDRATGPASSPQAATIETGATVSVSPGNHAPQRTGEEGTAYFDLLPGSNQVSAVDADGEWFGEGTGTVTADQHSFVSVNLCYHPDGRTRAGGA